MFIVKGIYQQCGEAMIHLNFYKYKHSDIHNKRTHTKGRRYQNDRYDLSSGYMHVYVTAYYLALTNLSAFFHLEVGSITKAERVQIKHKLRPHYQTLTGPILLFTETRIYLERMDHETDGERYSKICMYGFLIFLFSLTAAYLIL